MATQKNGDKKKKIADKKIADKNLKNISGGLAGGSGGGPLRQPPTVPRG